MFKRLASACSVAALSLLGIVSGAAPASATGEATYCFYFPNGEYYMGLPAQVEVATNEYGWVAIYATTTGYESSQGCFSYIFPANYTEYYSRATATAVDRLGRTWYGETALGSPGLQAEVFEGVVYCHGTNC